MQTVIINSYQKQALLDLHEAGFDAVPYANWVLVNQGSHRWRPVFTTQGVDSYIATHEPPIHE